MLYWLRFLVVIRRCCSKIMNLNNCSKCQNLSNYHFVGESSAKNCLTSIKNYWPINKDSLCDANGNSGQFSSLSFRVLYQNSKNIRKIAENCSLFKLTLLKDLSNSFLFCYRSQTVSDNGLKPFNWSAYLREFASFALYFVNVF